MRAPARYAFNKEDYTAKIEILQDDLTGRVFNNFLTEKGQTTSFLGEDNE